MDRESFIEAVQGRLIVSCQALEDEPLHGSTIMARMATAAEVGGAAGIRANGPDDVRAIRAVTALPIIGLYKDGYEGVYITPGTAHVAAIIEAGADVVAADATLRPRSTGEELADLVKATHDAGKLFLADVATLAEAETAQGHGADFVAPTLSGYTDDSPPRQSPDFDLLRTMVDRLSIPVLAEGHITTPEHARMALDCGVLAVVVGSAITRPQTITARFAAALRSAKS